MLTCKMADSNYLFILHKKVSKQATVSKILEDIPWLMSVANVTW